MPSDFAEIEAFYQTRQGGLARRLIGHQLRQLWPEADLRGRVVMGLGYAVPFLPALDAAERAFALLPAGPDNGHNAPPEAAGRAALAREDDLPLPDRSVDRVLLVHALECSPDPGRLLREVWRVLADGGRLIAVAPNRRGVWCLSERTPFGHGQPFSAGQLGRRLDGHLFERRAERGALYMPPTGSRLLLRLAVPAERLGLSLVPNLAGVVLVEAEKRVYAGTPLALRAAPARGYVRVPRSLAAARRAAAGLPRAA